MKEAKSFLILSHAANLRPNVNNGCEDVLRYLSYFKENKSPRETLKKAEAKIM